MGDPRFLVGVLSIALGALGLTSTLLLKLGRLKPESPWAGGSVLGMLFLSIGVLGFGLDYLFDAMGERAGSEFNPPVIIDRVLGFMIPCILVGLVIEWRAQKKRKLRSTAGE